MTSVEQIAVLSDIHGNLRALEAALEEVERDKPDAIVVCGDVASGPFVGETLDRLMAFGERAHFVRGNADRQTIAAYDDHRQYDPQEESPARRFASWTAPRLNQRQRDFLASFKKQVILDVSGLGRVLFCHGSPRSDEEIITSLTPEADLENLCAGVEEKVVVCGHTHHQFDRKAGRYRVINPGSVGFPYEGKPGAYWLLLGPGVDLRSSAYDFVGAVSEAISTGYPDLTYRDTILTPPGPEEVSAYFEEVAAKRGERIKKDIHE